MSEKQKYIIDHDCHIHSKFSLCSNDPQQTKENILKYGIENNYKYLCVTDHFWDETAPGANGWYEIQCYKHTSENLPLPQSEKTHFYFGGETDMNKDLQVGITLPVLEKLDFLVVSTTHLHMRGYTISEEDWESIPRRAELYQIRLRHLLEMDLPFEKIGIAHLTCGHSAPIKPDGFLELLQLITDKDFEEIFGMAAKKGAGIELNFNIQNASEEKKEIMLRPYRIAKKMGCKFYCGSDMHHPPQDIHAPAINFQYNVDALELTEDDKFRPFDK